jgi:hypothetical protein
MSPTPEDPFAPIFEKLTAIMGDRPVEDLSDDELATRQADVAEILRRLDVLMAVARAELERRFGPAVASAVLDR